MNNYNDHNDRENGRKNPSLPQEIKRPEIEDNRSGGREPRKAPGKNSSQRINRVLYVTAIVLLLSVAVIAAVTSAANRSKKNPLETPLPSKGPGSTPIVTPAPSAPESTPESTPPAESGNTEDVGTKLPTFLLPVSGTLATGHDPELQVFSPTMQEYRVHLGLDINTTEGAPVYSAAKGEVTKVWNDAMMGWCIEVSHDGNAKTYYKNLSETLGEGISEGARVTAGQLLGAVGESAMLEVAQEPHLHFEMTVDGKAVDPLDYFASDVIAELDKDEGYEG